VPKQKTLAFWLTMSVCAALAAVALCLAVVHGETLTEYELRTLKRTGAARTEIKVCFKHYRAKLLIKTTSPSGFADQPASFIIAAKLALSGLSISLKFALLSSE
jgi:cobalamin biosynthesis protein CbiD